LLDLWEAREIIGWTIPVSVDPVDTQIAAALLKLQPIDDGFYQQLVSEVAAIRAGAKYLPAAVTIKPPSDALNQYGKTGCTLEGMMLYDGVFNRLMIDSDIFSHLLDNTNIAAAWVHEAIYKVFRDLSGHVDSRQARKLTACLFASDDCLAISTGAQVPPNSYRCTSDSMDFYYSPDNDGSVYGRLLISRIQNFTFNDLLVWRPTGADEDILSGVLFNYGYSVARFSIYSSPVTLNFPDGSVVAKQVPSRLEFRSVGNYVNAESSFSCTPP
jgi:hypothetical protein